MNSICKRRSAIRGGLLALAAVGGLAGVSGCGAADAQHAPDISVQSSSVPAPENKAEPLARSKPVTLDIPDAKVTARKVLPLGLDSSGELEVPPPSQGGLPGYYTKAVTPGEVGPAIMVAHYDTRYGLALMKNAADIKIGSEIKIGRQDGIAATFKVRQVSQVSKGNFPTQKVYGETNRPELRLITCGGPIVDGHRADNIIFYADLV
ncbi:sortase [Streptomyces sp. NPDC006283]|uniref:sortase domain-containing protein n=1 Tax=Streptomyces sp. NPDC006283 TaxID=3156741 RepID=UPI0033A1DAEE